MPTDGMAIRLHLRRKRLVRVVEDQFDKLVVDVADTRRVVRCPACGYKTSKVHETQWVEIRDLPQASRRRRCGCSGASSASTAGIGTPRTTPRSRARSPCVWPDGWRGIRNASRSGSCRVGIACRGTRSWAAAAWAAVVGARRRESRCRVLLITSGFYGISKEGAP
jgi:hypothetical protein